MLISTSNEIMLSLMDEGNDVLARSIFTGMDLWLTPRAQIATTQIWRKISGLEVHRTEYQPLTTSLRMSVNGGPQEYLQTGTPFLLNTGSVVGSLALNLFVENLDPSLNVANAEHHFSLWVSERPVTPPPVTVESSEHFGQVLMTLTNASHPLPDESCQVNLSVTYKSWDLVTYSDGSRRSINQMQGPAKGAPVTFSIPAADSGRLSKGLNFDEPLIQRRRNFYSVKAAIRSGVVQQGSC